MCRPANMFLNLVNADAALLLPSPPIKLLVNRIFGMSMLLNFNHISATTPPPPHPAPTEMGSVINRDWVNLGIIFTGIKTLKEINWSQGVAKRTRGGMLKGTKTTLFWSLFLSFIF
jgi:hypothetical protein